MNNSHSQSIPAEVLELVNTKLSEINVALKPYIITLSADERHSMLKMGDKSSSFVDKTYEYTKTNPEFIPAFMNVAEFGIDIADLKGLVGTSSMVTQLSNTVDDTMMTAGSEAYYAALYYYKSVQQAADMNIPGAKAICEELKKRFPSKSRKAEVVA
jgi:hypothetical protein